MIDTGIARCPPQLLVEALVETASVEEPGQLVGDGRRCSRRSAVATSISAAVCCAKRVAASRRSFVGAALEPPGEEADGVRRRREVASTIRESVDPSARPTCCAATTLDVYVASVARDA